MTNKRAELRRLQGEIKFLRARYDFGAMPPAIGKVLNQLQARQRELELDLAWAPKPKKRRMPCGNSGR